MIASIDRYCSGATAVSVIKKGRHLPVSNLGDSRAVLRQRGNKNSQQLVPIQLIVNLKPNVPGLAMARAFGDFCLKDYDLISTTQVFYKKAH
ncbi:Probable protein phosphatase 2C 33 [Linum perenne]